MRSRESSIKIETEFGTVEQGISYWDGSSEFSVEGLDTGITVGFPDFDDADDLAKGVTLKPDHRYAGLTVEEADRFAELLKFASDFAALYNESIGDAVAEAKRKAEERQAELDKCEAERAAVIAERAERLLTEFMGERGRIRVRGSKSYQPVIIGAVERSDGEYEPRFEWVNDHDYHRERRLSRVVRFDIKVGSRYQEVWNDGQDDLNPWDRDRRAGNAPKYDGALS